MEALWKGILPLFDWSDVTIIDGEAVPAYNADIPLDIFDHGCVAVNGIDLNDPSSPDDDDVPDDPADPDGSGELPTGCSTATSPRRSSWSLYLALGLPYIFSHLSSVASRRRSVRREA
jgi:hypothetical protein